MVIIIRHKTRNFISGYKFYCSNVVPAKAGIQVIIKITYTSFSPGWKPVVSICRSYGTLYFSQRYIFAGLKPVVIFLSFLRNFNADLSQNR